MSYQSLNGDNSSTGLTSGRTDSAGGQVDEPTGMAFEDLIWALPRLFDRTSKQLELARLVASHIPCVGSLVPFTGSKTSGFSSHDPGDGESIDVLEVLSDDRPEKAPLDSTETPGSAAPETSGAKISSNGPAATAVPSEVELAVAGYDSLAASQVVPRLATLTITDLAMILAYEQAHRNRQTIVHRVRQLLEN
ncbi:MAG TPA: hypothetical protein VL068_10425 [Microthrixaceae bacterium]|nr:hypothetical protein [Microthrixaceae bacterium]